MWCFRTNCTIELTSVPRVNSSVLKFFINIVINSFSKFSKNVNSILIFVGWNNSLLNSMPGLVLLYDMIEWLMNILHSMPGVLSTLHSMPGVYLNELCTPHARSLFELCTPCQAYPEIMGSLLICISKMAVSSSQKFLQRFLKEIFCSGVRAFFWGEIFDIKPVETSTANFS